jgi:hypothetical protein
MRQGILIPLAPFLGVACDTDSSELSDGDAHGGRSAADSLGAIQFISPEHRV